MTILDAIATEDQAQAAAPTGRRQRTRAVHRGALEHDEVITSPTLRRLLEAHDQELAVANVSELTRGDRRRLLRQWIAWLDGRDPLTASRDDVIAFLNSGPWSPQTRHTYRGHLRGFYRWLVDTDRLSVDPTAKVPPVRVPGGVPKPFTPEQLERALQLPEPVRTWVILAAFAGLRCIEIAGLRGEDVDHAAGTLFIRRGKGGRPAVLPAHSRVLEALASLPRQGVLWRGPAGEPVTAPQVSSLSFRALKLAGIGGSLHRARHSFATNLLQKSGNLRLVQELMRHSSPATTARYTEVSLSERRAAVEGL